MVSPMSFNCKILSIYRLPLEIIKQLQNKINLIVKGRGEHHLLGTVNFHCYIDRAMTGRASHRVANRDYLSWARLLGGVNSANTTPSNEKF